MSKVVVMLKTINILYLCFLCVGPPLVAGGRAHLNPGKEDKVYAPHGHNTKMINI
jgi:hypothetical protein